MARLFHGAGYLQTLEFMPSSPRPRLCGVFAGQEWMKRHETPSSIHQRNPYYINVTHLDSVCLRKHLSYLPRILGPKGARGLQGGDEALQIVEGDLSRQREAQPLRPRRNAGKADRPSGKSLFAEQARRFDGF